MGRKRRATARGPDEADVAAGYASPPCYLHEVDPAYLGYLSPAEVIALLNELLEAERAGARGVGEMARRATGARARSLLREVAADEARFCAMLTRHVRRLGGRASRKTGSFHDKLLAEETLPAQLALLDRGQGWVVRKLAEALPRIADDALHADLREMREVHERNVERCGELASELGEEAGDGNDPPPRRV